MYVDYRFGVSVDEMLGKTFISVDASEDCIQFVEQDGTRWVMQHDQDCCESVTIEDICGDITDLVGSEILHAEESVSTQEDDLPPANKYDSSYTWTFYRFRTIKGSVVIRWYGTSSGYYSESVDVYRIPAGRE